jgi:hypothetical protein
MFVACLARICGEWPVFAFSFTHTPWPSLGQQSGFTYFTLKGRRSGPNHSNGQTLPAKWTTKPPKWLIYGWRFTQHHCRKS